MPLNATLLYPVVGMFYQLNYKATLVKQATLFNIKIYLASTVDQHLTLDISIACFYCSDGFSICDNGINSNFFKYFDA